MVGVGVRTSSRLLLVVLQVAMLPLPDRLLPVPRPGRLLITLRMIVLVLLVTLMGIAPDRRPKSIGRRQTSKDFTWL